MSVKVKNEKYDIAEVITQYINAWEKDTRSGAVKNFDKVINNMPAKYNEIIWDVLNEKQR